MSFNIEPKIFYDISTKNADLLIQLASVPKSLLVNLVNKKKSLASNKRKTDLLRNNHLVNNYFNRCLCK